ALAIALIILAFLLDMLNYSFMQIQIHYLDEKKISYMEYRFPSLYYLFNPQKKTNRYYIRFIKEGFGNIVVSSRVDTSRLIRALQKNNKDLNRYLDELLYLWNAQLAPFNKINSKQELKHRLYYYDPANRHPIYYERTKMLHQAQDIESIDALLAQGATINDLNRQGQHILHFAQDSNLTKYIITLGASINYPDMRGHTPIMKAIQNYQKTQNQEYLKIIKLFLAHHADTRKALSVTHDIEIAKLLLTYDANVNEIDPFGHSVLHDLVHQAKQNPKNYYAIINFLIDNKADINHTDNIKRSLLHKTTDPSMIILLLDKGIDTTLRNHRDKSAYEYWLSKYEELKRYPFNVYHLRSHKAYFNAVRTYENYFHLAPKIKQFEPHRVYAQYELKKHKESMGWKRLQIGVIVRLIKYNVRSKLKRDLPLLYYLLYKFY
ncbi:MAG: hypothetical protein JXQ76_09780, partial [Campylobacterales bacterium]|nr:hypothetical protein [Campylobacterales bacterium]